MEEKKPYYESARIIESDKLSEYVSNPEDLAELKQDQDLVMQAKCWGTLNQGLLRKGIEEVRHEFASAAIRSWNEVNPFLLLFLTCYLLSLLQSENSD